MTRPAKPRAAQVILLNKIDLLPHLDFDVEKAIANARMVNPDAIVFRVSARSGEGLEVWYDWIRAAASASKGRRHVRVAEPTSTYSR